MSLISIVMPAFNADKYIKQALDSMINQTYRDLQIVVIDDGSTDHTAEILHQYQRIDSRIEILHIENQGCSVAMNRGVEYASGDYIARMDADDISVTNRLEIQLAYIKRNALDLCGSAVDAFYKGMQKRWSYPLTENEIRTQLLFNSPFAHPTIIAKAEVLKKNPYCSGHAAAEDYSLWAKLAGKEYRFANSSEALLKYRVHKNQVSTAQQGCQHSKRHLVAKDYWMSLGMSLPAKNITRFNSSYELKEMIRELSAAKLSFIDKKTLDLALWKMAIRSELSGTEIYYQLLRHGVELTKFQKISLSGILLSRGLFPAAALEQLRIFRPNI